MSGQVNFPEKDSAEIQNPPTAYRAFWVDDDGVAYLRDSSGTDLPFASSAEVTAAIAAAKIGLYNLRGTYNAASNLFPSAGGSGTAGAILKADVWIIDTPGTLGGVAVDAGDQVVALIDSPGQTASNWAITEKNLGYVPVPPSRTVNTYPLSANIVIGSDDIDVDSGPYIGGTITAALTAIDSDKQDQDSDLSAIAALTPSDDDIMQRKGGAWTNRTIVQVLSDMNAVVYTEASTTPVADNSENAATLANTRCYAYATVPSDHRNYIITGIEWKNGSAVAGNVTAGVDIVEANPPVLAATPMVALSQQIAQAGTNAVQRVSIISSRLIPAGSIIGGWFYTDGAGKFRRLDGQSSGNYRKGVAYTVAAPSQDATAWTGTTNREYVKIYLRGV